MRHYTVWNITGGFKNLEESIHEIGNNRILTQEIIEVLEILIDKIDFLEKDSVLPYSLSLKVHGRYTRDQILTAFGFNTFVQKSSIREGIAYSEEKNTELLFITLNKTEKNFSPTTLYEDFAISETLSHRQSQNSARPDKGRGLSYIEHQENKKKILLFIREKNEDEFGNVMGFVFIGEGNMLEQYRSKPMSINWELDEPMPYYLWKEAGKMAVE